ncbi:hypothetical protein LQR31_16425 [Chromobacterium vaccinii]|uniref:hypothetical protein n=1 Tax=Chromobacterium vaccinii TaxID=1108595 RepID=UPI001E46DC78|nr:hypothetical protein [Chromobacterium vaccinii]MCD4486060.1 hypothetical protein [Chromobacterium vaccinii]
MNNPLQIPVAVLPGPLPTATVISAAELAARQDISAAMEAERAAARDDADALRRQAQAELEQARLDADALREAARLEGERLAVLAREEAVADAVRWLCCEQEMEGLIARQLALRWRGITAGVLEALLGNCDQSELLLRRVERQVARLLPRGSVNLHVAPQALRAAEQAYADVPEVAVLADAALSVGQARLDNGLVRIHLDTPAHQARVLEQLRGDAREVAHA